MLSSVLVLKKYKSNLQHLLITKLRVYEKIKNKIRNSNAISIEFSTILPTRKLKLPVVTPPR